MATVTSRKRSDGTKAHMAQIVIKRKGVVVHRENKTHSSRQAAYAWAAAREKELKAPGGLDAVKNKAKTLGDAIRKFLEIADTGDTKNYVLERMLAYPIADMAADQIGSAELIELMMWLRKTVSPQTVENYVSHLTPIFKLAKPAWGIQLNNTAFREARDAARELGLTGNSNKRDRRPTLDELDALMKFFHDRYTAYPRTAPMHKIIAFAIFSARRKSEILRISYDDYEPDHSRVLVRDMKHPGQTKGNDQWVNLTDEAMAIIASMPKTAPEIFPYGIHGVGKAFTEACGLLGINDLHFHDLRHEGISRLFEIGWNIPHVATVSGHLSWTNLKRYSHIMQRGDKYADWKWMETVTCK